MSFSSMRRNCQGFVVVWHLLLERRRQFLSPLRTDSRQLVSKIYWWQSAKNGIMREPEWREPTGFVWFAPAGGGNVWVDVNRRIIQNYPHGRGFYVTEFACLVPALPA